MEVKMWEVTREEQMLEVDYSGLENVQRLDEKALRLGDQARHDTILAQNEDMSLDQRVCMSRIRVED